MKNLTPYAFLLLLFGLLLAPVQTAAAQEEEPEPPLRGELPVGIGVQYAAPAFGISGMYDVTDQISVQAVFGFFGGLQMYSGRGLYHFNQQEAYNIYGFGTVGAWRYSTTSVLGVGGGAGLEYSWQQLFDSAEIPPLFGNIEIGFVHLSDDFSGYTFSSLTYGGGIHYRF